jgi:hypothetical protein
MLYRGDSSHTADALRACVVSQGNSIDVCTQQAGDLVFVPGLWHHATLNLAETVAVAWRTS